MSNYFTSDLHLHHKSIAAICNRPFADVDEMTEKLIENNNAVVTDKDDVWDLGDFAYRCSPEAVRDALQRLKGRRHILLGNHDKALRQAYKKGMLDGMLQSGKLEIIGGQTAIYDSTLIIAKQLKIDGQLIVMSHYAYRTWIQAFRKSIHLYGHSHGNLSEPYYNSFDVGVDSHDYRPWSWEELKAKIESIQVEFKEE